MAESALPADDRREGLNRIVSLYWDNIDPRVVETQRAVFAHFGFTIEQREQTGVGHGDFLDAFMRELNDEDIALFVDIDCFPLNRAIVEQAIAAARAGRLFGCAQSTNHIDPDRIFAAPMFLSLAKRTWNALGRPSFRPDPENDVAQALNAVAADQGVPVDLIYPWGSIVPRWRLGDVALYGIGTFYRGGVFHLFESRRTPFSYILFDVADCVLHDRPIDYGALLQKAMNTRGSQKWARRFARWRKAIWWRRLQKRLGLRA
jgi:hypothetical protein